MSPQQGDPWESLWEDFEALRMSVTRSRAQNVNANSLRVAARDLVQRYFRKARPELMSLGAKTDEVSQLDSLMQVLLRLANGQNSKTSYVRTLRAMGRVRPQIDVYREMRLGQSDREPLTQAARSPKSVEGKILSTLQLLLPSAAASYEQALLDLEASPRLSYRGSAAELREALREVLDQFAPDEAVMKSSGFNLEKGRTKPTMRQKARFILKSRGGTDSSMSSSQDAIARIEEAASSLARSVYERGALSTHVATTRRELRQLKRYTDAILGELLEID